MTDKTGDSLGYSLTLEIAPSTLPDGPHPKYRRSDSEAPLKYYNNSCIQDYIRHTPAVECVAWNLHQEHHALFAQL